MPHVMYTPSQCSKLVLHTATQSALLCQSLFSLPPYSDRLWPHQPTIQWVSGHLSIQSGWQSAQLGHFCLMLGVWRQGDINLLTQTLTTWCLINQNNIIHLIASKVDTVTGLWEEKQSVLVRFPSKTRDFSLFTTIPNSFGLRPRPIFERREIFLLRV